MGRTPRTVSRSSALVLAISLGEWRTRLMYMLLAGLASLLIILNKSENPAIHTIRSAATEVLAPAMGFITQPVQGMQSFGTQWQQWQDVYTQNSKLRAENEKLKQWYDLGKTMHAENKSLRKLLNMAPSHAGSFISGKMLGGAAGPYSRSQFISVGIEDGVKHDMAVLAGEGLVGRVQEVSGHNARVMLLTDMSSRIAVVTQQGQENAMAVGRNGDLLELRYLPKKTRVKLGEMVMTSGDAALMPSGIPLGKVVKVTPQEVLVKPLVDWSRLSFVSVVAPE